MTSGDDESLAHQVSYEVDGVSEWTALFDAVVEVLSRTIRCDEVGWTGLDRGERRALVHTGIAPAYDETIVRLLVELDDHPVINHFMAGGADAITRPVRVGDLISDRDFRRTRTWTDLFGPRGIDRQLTVLTEINRHHTAASGWSLNRAGREFSDAELAALAGLRPLLTALETSPSWRVDPDRVDAGTRPEPGVRGGVRLTPREVQVLALLAEGLTAVAIGHRLRISPLTVRKHLEHLYDKTGRRDRMGVVLFAQEAGFLRPRGVVE